jgi:hypothetical protein
LNQPRITGIGKANPPLRLTQEQSFCATGYESERIHKIFLNSDIDFRHLYLEGNLNRNEGSDQLNQRYLRGAFAYRLSRDSRLFEVWQFFSSRRRFPCRLYMYGLRLS